MIVDIAGIVAMGVIACVQKHIHKHEIRDSYNQYIKAASCVKVGAASFYRLKITMITAIIKP